MKTIRIMSTADSGPSLVTGAASNLGAVGRTVILKFTTLHGKGITAQIQENEKVLC
jgi:hypothetical protein